MLDTSSLDLHHELLERADKVRPLPSSVTQLSAVVADPSKDIDDIVTVIRSDPIIVAALLREANSAASASRNEIATIEGAVLRLGSARALAVAVASTFSQELEVALDGYGMRQGELWQHSVIASHVAEAIRPLSSRPLGPELVTVALLHDLGKIVLTELANHNQLNAAQSGTGDLASAERELYDIDHAELGAWLTRAWGLPASLWTAIRYHHEPEDAPDDLAHGLFISDRIAHELDPGSDNRPAQDDEQYIASLEYLGFSHSGAIDASTRILIRVGLLASDN